MGHVSSEEAQLKLQEAKEDLDLQDGGRWEGTPEMLVGLFQGKSHRSKWMMTGGTPMAMGIPGS